MQLAAVATGGAEKGRGLAERDVTRRNLCCFSHPGFVFSRVHRVDTSEVTETSCGKLYVGNVKSYLSCIL